RYCLTNAGEGTQLWQLEAAPLPREDLTGLGQIFSGLRVDPTGALEALPLPVQTNLYASLRTLHPKYFSLNDKPFNSEPIRPHIQVPARNADTALEQIDLSPYYNARLDESWQGGDPGNDLAKLPIGVQLLHGVRFDVRGLVQLTSQSAFSYRGRSYPNRVSGMQLHVKCHYLHFLQAAGWRVPAGLEVGRYLIHYQNGQQLILPVVYGEDVRDWWAVAADPPKRATVAWQATNGTGHTVGLCHRVWENPKPEVEITHIDFVSSMTLCAPFLVAITAEP